MEELKYDYEHNLASFCFERMKELHKGKLSVAEAHAHAQLAKQINSALRLHSDKQKFIFFKEMEQRKQIT